MLRAASLLRVTAPRLAIATARPLQQRAFSSSAVEDMAAKLEQELAATDVLVEDISGGCGSMYKLEVTSAMFASARSIRLSNLKRGAFDDLSLMRRLERAC